MLQAESEKLRQAWIQAVQASIASAYRESPDTYYIEVRQRIREHQPSVFKRYKQCSTKQSNLMSGFVVCHSYLAPGPNGFSVHQQHRLGQRAAGAQRPRGDHPAEDPVSAGQRAVLRLRPGRPSLGLHQPRHPAVHRVLRHPQVEKHSVSLWESQEESDVLVLELTKNILHVDLTDGATLLHTAQPKEKSSYQFIFV